MLRSGLEDYGYNSHVGLAKLVELYMDVLETMGAIIR